MELGRLWQRGRLRLWIKPRNARSFYEYSYLIDNTNNPHYFRVVHLVYVP